MLALAGDSEGARREAAGTPFAPLWEALLAGGLPPVRDWEALAALGPYRAARLVYDLDLLSPGSAPSSWRREAIAIFRKLGAAAPAERLEARDGGPWAVVALLLQGFAGEAAGEIGEEPPPATAGRAGGGRSGEKRPGGGEPGAARRDRPPGPAGPRRTAGADPGRERHRQGAGRARGSTAQRPRRRPFVAVNCAALSETLLLPICSVTRAAPSPAPNAIARECSRPLTAARCSSTRSAISRSPRRAAAARVAGRGDPAAGGERGAAGGCPRARGHSSRSRRHGGGGIVPARSLLSPARRLCRAAGAARARRRPVAHRRSLAVVWLDAIAAGRRRGSAARRGRACSRIAGPATCANWKTCFRWAPRSPAAA